MITNRLKNVISGSLSGWYGTEWGKTLLWHDDKLMVKDAGLADEISYNLESIVDYDIKINKPTVPSFSDWAAEISLG